MSTEENLGLLIGSLVADRANNKAKKLEENYLENPTPANYFKLAGYKDFYDLENKYSGKTEQSIEKKYEIMNMDPNVEKMKKTELLELSLLRLHRDEIAEEYGIVVRDVSDKNGEQSPTDRKDVLIGLSLIFIIIVIITVLNN